MTYKFTPGEYLTRDGRKAVVLCDDAPGMYPLIGYVLMRQGDAAANTWAHDGAGVFVGTKMNDLMPPVTEPEQVVRWVHLWSDNDITINRESKQGRGMVIARARVVLTPGVFDDEATPDPYTRGWNDALDSVIRSDYRDDASLRAEKKETRP
jgi:hypothetical protein